MLNPLDTGQGLRNHDLSAALATAINDWQIEKWTSKDQRLKGSIVVGTEDGPTAAAEIRKRAGDKNFVQVLLLSRNVEPLGQRRYWPIYEAAQEIGLPVGVHAFGFGGNPITASGWPSFYIEEMVGHSQCQQTALAMSLCPWPPAQNRTVWPRSVLAVTSLPQSTEALQDNKLPTLILRKDRGSMMFRGWRSRILSNGFVESMSRLSPISTSGAEGGGLPSKHCLWAGAASRPWRSPPGFRTGQFAMAFWNSGTLTHCLPGVSENRELVGDLVKSRSPISFRHWKRSSSRMFEETRCRP